MAEKIKEKFNLLSSNREQKVGELETQLTELTDKVQSLNEELDGKTQDTSMSEELQEKITKLTEE